MLRGVDSRLRGNDSDALVEIWFAHSLLSLRGANGDEAISRLLVLKPKTG